jgi:hypothetical protein
VLFFHHLLVFGGLNEELAERFKAGEVLLCGGGFLA